MSNRELSLSEVEKSYTKGFKLTTHEQCWFRQEGNNLRMVMGYLDRENGGITYMSEINLAVEVSYDPNLINKDEEITILTLKDAWTADINRKQGYIKAILLYLVKSGYILRLNATDNLAMSSVYDYMLGLDNFVFGYCDEYALSESKTFTKDVHHVLILPVSSKTAERTARDVFSKVCEIGRKLSQSTVNNDYEPVKLIRGEEYALLNRELEVYKVGSWMLDASPVTKEPVFRVRYLTHRLDEEDKNG